MFPSHFRRLMSLLLAVLLVASAIAPPTVGHTHEVASEGSIHHVHRGAAPSSRRESRSYGVHHRHVNGQHVHAAHSQPRQADMGRAAWWHLHLHWFGFQLTLPDPDFSPDDDEQCTDHKILVSATIQDSEFCHVNRSSWVTCCVWPVASLALESVAALQARWATRPPVLCAPLCDSARHERTGVLLA